jgi:clan AA aspartic protease
MGHVRVKLRIANANRPDERVEVEDALVDTGASWTIVPRRIADELTLPILGKRTARTVSGTVEVDRSYALVEWEGREGVHEILVSDTYPGVLVGVLTLESMALAVDPKTGRLVDSELLLL